MTAGHGDERRQQQKGSIMGRTPYLVAAALLAAGVGGTAFAAGHSNPVDRVSNPSALDYTDVEISLRHLEAPFVRDGTVVEPGLFATIEAGLALAQVQSILGEPLRKRGSQGLEWDYNFQFRLPQSQNFLVCQYKVVFDKHERVREAIWRRRQCQQLARAESGAP